MLVSVVTAVVLAVLVGAFIVARRRSARNSAVAFAEKVGLPLDAEGQRWLAKVLTKRTTLGGLGTLVGLLVGLGVSPVLGRTNNILVLVGTGAMGMVIGTFLASAPTSGHRVRDRQLTGVGVTDFLHPGEEWVMRAVTAVPVIVLLAALLGWQKWWAVLLALLACVLTGLALRAMYTRQRQLLGRSAEPTPAMLPWDDAFRSTQLRDGRRLVAGVALGTAVVLGPEAANGTKSPWDLLSLLFIGIGVSVVLLLSVALYLWPQYQRFHRLHRRISEQSGPGRGLR